MGIINLNYHYKKMKTKNIILLSLLVIAPIFANANVDQTTISSFKYNKESCNLKTDFNL
jgi:hypothetical protein